MKRLLLYRCKRGIFISDLVSCSDFIAIMTDSRAASATGAFKDIAMLMTPAVNLQSLSCIRVIFQSFSFFWVLARYFDSNGLYVEEVLFRSMLPIAHKWSQLHLDIGPKWKKCGGERGASLVPGSCGSQPVVIVFKTQATNDGSPSAMIADVALFSGECELTGLNIHELIDDEYVLVVPERV